ncbi:chromate transporter [Tissierella sp. MSJ-40]|uniref:Chromate transporter n=1 Tax=Tissierella simiarum TaxID=2841534 RepID=A0ABS6EAF2_9FIRM|nr:chromate transporter [Tissierella simiarum]MBU5439910.1 chromate transporter [Tissierella simiarum]
MVEIKLFYIFFKLGLLSFGGGYTLIPLIQQELEKQGWMSSSQFHDLIAISEVTPGSVSLNTATYIGYEIGGVLGSILATLGVVLPSLIIITLITSLVMKQKKEGLLDKAFYGIRSVVTGLILSAAFLVGETSLFNESITVNGTNGARNVVNIINGKSLAILILVLFLMKKTKIHPILLILCSGLLGVLMFYIFK